MNTYRHTTGRFWFYGESADRANRWHAPGKTEQAMLCVRDGDAFNLILYEEDAAMDGCDRHGGREVWFGADTTYPSDQRNGYRIPFQ